MKDTVTIPRYDHVQMVGLMKPQKGKKEDVDRIYIEFESNLAGDFYCVSIDPYEFIEWIGEKEVKEFKNWVKTKIDKL